MIRPLVQLGNPILREAAKDLNSPALTQRELLFVDLMDTLQAAGGVGIAAPQIGESVRAAIVSPHANERYPNSPETGPITLINPEIIWVSKTLEKDWEGCLSIPGVRGLVPRHTHIKVRFYDRLSAREVTRKYQGFTARVFQHELDHLLGTVFLDRVENKVDLADEEEYKQLLAKSRSAGV